MIAASGTKGLRKVHRPGCSRPRRLTDCDCAWLGRYKGRQVTLAKWSGKSVSPREVGPAKIVLGRMIALIDAGDFDPAGEHRTSTSKQTLAEFIEDWWIDYVEKHGLAKDSLRCQCEVLAGVPIGRDDKATEKRHDTIRPSAIGRTALHDLSTEQIERWLHAEAKARAWGRKTWNEYHALLQRLLERAVVRRRLKYNPVRAIERMRGVSAQRGELRHVRLDEDLEARLFAVVDQLNRTQAPNTRSKLTQAIADEIRRRAEGGTTPQKDLAAEFGVSGAVVSQIVTGRIWNPARRRTTTKGTEMRRRLEAAFDLGVRAGEMGRIQLQHVNWTHPRKLVDDATGQPFNGYEIALPPELTKGGKRTGEVQYLYAATLRLSRTLEARRFQLRNKPTAYIFGDEAGHYVASFDKSWQALFTLAGLDYGRAKGLTWHTTRAEFVSRLVENEKDPAIAQDLARHARLETTQRYIHTRQDRRWRAAHGLNRG